MRSIKSILGTATLRQSGVTFFGTILNGALGAVFYILTARFLGPAAFGLMSVAVASLTLVADIGDLGTDTGLVNFVARYFKKEPTKAKRFLKLGLKVKFFVWLLVLLIGVLLAPFLAETVFTKPELALPLKIAFIGVGFLLFFSFITHALQAFQRFWSWSGIQVGANALRVLIIFGLLSLGILNLENTLWVYITMPLIGFLVGLVLISPDFLKVKKETSVAKEFFHYNKWVAAFTLAAAFGARLDTFISARLLDTTQLGIYSAANQLVKIVPQIVVALGTVIAPKMAAMGSMKDFVSYLKKTQVMVFVLAFLGILSIPIVLYLIPILFGNQYLASGPIFIVLLFAMLVFLISVPVHMSIFYYFSYPKLFFWLSSVHLLIIAALGWKLISVYGVMGAAFTVLVGQIFNFVVPTYWVLRKVISSRK